MPPRKKKNPPAPTPTPTPAQSRPAAPKRKQPVSWEKDGVDGFSSIRILIEWLTSDGNFKRWRGKKGNGLNKEALASEVVALMVSHGIHHRNNKDIRTKIQELQDNYSSACNWLRNTGSGVLDEDIANGTDNVRAAVIKRCKYFYDLDEVMRERTCAIPEDIVDTTSGDVPDIINPPSEGPEGVLDPLIDSIGEGNKGSDQDGSVADSGTAAKSNTKAPFKSKKPKKSTLPAGLEKAIQDTSDYRVKCLQSKERRDAKRLKLERCRIRIEESDAQVRRVLAEAEQAKLRISCMKELKESGFGDEDISKFLQQQFGQGPSHQSDSESSDDVDTD
ncbi:uncharacterized protein PGTG_22001 [Puccinia graminis f. sp. tritici CRL 75-36-700-3]|uniref:Uncharacterized protein n=1 Tax=Puccinia graminis f. sp. tritici (strain CRL 75-36-700-3 / race SCCL) TaxID=418459 RepID=H6QT83_PUCGT|nr:uncharacterized protein PGTG_22001 [Puccinia graminis f. sp. tritici CRL 75-36-700-3]EHS64037.1 hypothetical protein PGTG_22001 [Puccinia graminis f. sp. tritici CRL 75-36-700-3]